VTATLANLVCAVDGALDAPTERWVSGVTDADRSVLDRAREPVIDIGCGPGRLVIALAERGITTLGIDVTPRAVEHARARGATVMARSVFERVPAAGRWASALLLDGNLGIGGDPIALLTRVAGLVRHDGIVLVELDPPGTDGAPKVVRLDIGTARGPWFALARVAADELDDLAAATALDVTERWSCDHRWFASLRARS
jgi:SAM-dependent methyltransferase